MFKFFCGNLNNNTLPINPQSEKPKIKRLDFFSIDRAVLQDVQLDSQKRQVCIIW